MKKVQVWDLPIRLFHWLLVIMIIMAIYSIKSPSPNLKMHQYVGVFILILLLFRVIWGLIGSSTARFWDFIKGPSATYHYLRYGISTTEGHNPVGAFMVLFMLLVLFIQVITGLFLEDNTWTFTDAPLYKHLPTMPWLESISGIFANDKMSTRAIFAWIHAKNLYVIYGMIGLHLFALLLYFVIKGQNLVKTMMIGSRTEKELHSPMAQGIKYNRPWLALLIFIILGIVVPYMLFACVKGISFIDWIQSNLSWLKGLIFGA